MYLTQLLTGVKEYPSNLIGVEYISNNKYIYVGGMIGSQNNRSFLIQLLEMVDHLLINDYLIKYSLEEFVYQPSSKSYHIELIPTKYRVASLDCPLQILFIVQELSNIIRLEYTTNQLIPLYTVFILTLLEDPL